MKGYSDACEEKGLDFKFNVERETMDSIEVDPFRIEELIHSLINNAIRFTEKGFVEVYLEFKKQVNTATFIFEVKDSGIGISSQNLKKVFKPFFKIENSLNKKFLNTKRYCFISKKSMPFFIQKGILLHMKRYTFFHLQKSVFIKRIYPFISLPPPSIS